MAAPLFPLASVPRAAGGAPFTDPATQTTLAAILALLPAALGGAGGLKVDVVAQTLAVLKAREDTAAMTWVSARSVAPAANTVQADTGALGAGDYDFDLSSMCSDTVAVGKGLIVQHRNAANSANIQTFPAANPNGGFAPQNLRRYTMAANERLRFITDAVAGAAGSLYVCAIGRRVA